MSNIKEYKCMTRHFPVNVKSLSSTGLFKANFWGSATVRFLHVADTVLLYWAQSLEEAAFKNTLFIRRLEKYGWTVTM